MDLAGLNLATLSTAEREAINADLIACRLIHQSQGMGKDRSNWCRKQMVDMTPERRELVIQAMKARAEK